MVSWPLQNRSWVVKTLQRQCPLLVEPEPGPCLWVPTRTNAPTGPHYCCRQLSLMSSRVSDSMQLLQMALPSHLALPLSIYRRWETCQWPTSLQRERKRSVMEFSTIWSQHYPNSALKAWEWWNNPQNRIQIKSFLDYFWWVLASVLSINAGHVGEAGREKTN